MTNTPRWMPWHQKLLDCLNAELRPLAQVPKVHHALCELVTAFRTLLPQFPLAHGELEATVPFLTAMDTLVNLLLEQAPKTTAVYGEHIYYLVCQWVCAACGVEFHSPYGTYMKIASLDPESPLRISADGGICGWEKALPRFLLQHSEYAKSLQPPQPPPGRPKKSLSTKPAKRQQQFDPRLAQRAATMKRDGNDWRSIAEALLPPFKTSESEKIRSRITRLIDRGNILLRNS